MKDDLPDDKICECGYQVMHYRPAAPGELDKKMGWDPGIRCDEDVVERPCPHHNGTVIQYCPKCDRKVGMWGMGQAGTMECDCWNTSVPWWRRLFRNY